MRIDTLSPPVELLWFRLPRLADDATELDPLPVGMRSGPLAVVERENDTAAAFVRWGPGRILLIINRVSHWQVGYIYPTGHYTEMHARA